MKKHGSLFTGIGGFDLAAQQMEWENVFQVEWDAYCQKVLAKNFPNTKRYGDIREFDGTPYAGTIDILSGGPPCQPASSAGKRKGEKDDRWLWPEAIRVLGEIRPRVGVFENPDDLLSLDDGRAFERICGQMEDLGYKVETLGIPACCVSAWHERDRIWIIAHADNLSNKRRLVNRSNQGKTKTSKGRNGSEGQASYGQWLRAESCTGGQVTTNTHSSGLEKSVCAEQRSVFEKTRTLTGCEYSRAISEIGAYWEAEPGVVRMVHGLSDRVDRIKSLGNAIVPQIAYQIFKAIELTYL